MISCDLQFHVLEKHVVHIIFIYNPYSIVNELLIAKISVEGNPAVALTADARGHSCFPAGNLQPEGETGYFASTVRSWWS